jgi:hypothetical protein
MPEIPAALEARFAAAVEHKNALVRGSRPHGAVEWARFHRDVSAAKTAIADLYREAAKAAHRPAPAGVTEWVGGMVWRALMDAADAFEGDARERFKQAAEREQESAAGGAS